ncbi:Cytochrome P450 [Canna indica]|uniref:Cytochrome P450 n=1 Tax=Canna indica TaxID=4628 RepID=A0AAQ3L2K8_9LILI|nr:Cytochrome P450 [Canna indica]
MELAPWAMYSAMILLVTLLGALASSRCGRRKLNLPPGPSPWPVIGNLNLIGPLPHRSLHALSQMYGSLMHLRLGSVLVVVGSSVEMAKSILKTHDISFASRPKSAEGKYTMYSYASMSYCPYGPYLRQARRICQNELFSPRKLDFFQYIRLEEVRALLRGLFESAGAPIVLKDYVSNATLNNICLMAFGKKYLQEKPEAAAIVPPEEFKEMIDELLFLNGVTNVGDLIPWLNFLDLQGYVRRMKKLSKKFDRFLEYILDEHEKQRRLEGDVFVAMDLVDVLLLDDPSLEVTFDRQGVKALAQDMIIGGTSTSTVTIEWAISELLKRPEIQDKATEELDRVIGRDCWVEEKDANRLPYIEAIVKETMRMHPAVPMLVPRLAREHTVVGGYDIPAGTRVLVNVWAIGRDPTIWDSPKEFQPERFVGNPIDVKGQHMELLPFGAGRRMCPGYSLGLKMIQLILANLLHGFKWRLPEGMKAEELSMEEIFGLSMPRKVPLRAVAEPKLPAHLYGARS